MSILLSKKVYNIKFYVITKLLKCSKNFLNKMTQYDILILGYMKKGEKMKQKKGEKLKWKIKK